MNQDFEDDNVDVLFAIVFVAIILRIDINLKHLIIDF